MKQKNNFRFHFLVLLAAFLMPFFFNTYAAKAAENEAAGGQ